MIKIVTDSTSMISPKEAKKYHISIIPLFIILGDKSFRDGVNIQGNQVVKYNLAHKKPFPKTSQPSVGAFVKTYQQLTKDGNSVISIHLGNSFSGTVNVATQASKLVKGNITVFNSKSVDQNIRYLVLVASKMAQSNQYSVSDIIKKLTEIREHSHLIMGVSTLTNLRKGGRVNMVAGFLSALLNLHVLVDLKPNQKFKIMSKGRGIKTFYKWLPSLTKYLKQHPVKYLGISYTSSNDFIVAMRDKIQSLEPDVPVVCRPTSATVSTHVGPGAFAVMFVTK